MAAQVAYGLNPCPAKKLRRGNIAVQNRGKVARVILANWISLQAPNGCPPHYRLEISPLAAHLLARCATFCRSLLVLRPGRRLARADHPVAPKLLPEQTLALAARHRYAAPDRAVPRDGHWPDRPGRAGQAARFAALCHGPGVLEGNRGPRRPAARPDSARFRRGRSAIAFVAPPEQSPGGRGDSGCEGPTAAGQEAAGARRGSF